MQKQCLSVLVALIALSATLDAQTPKFVNYQAIIRNAQNQPVTDASISVRVRILQGAPGGIVVFEETHVGESAENGLVQFALGSANPVGFTAIDWSNGPYFVKIDYDLDNGMAFSNTDAVQILSVPYAIYAEEAGNSGDWENVGDTLLIAVDKRIGIGISNPEYDLSVAKHAAFGSRIYPGWNGTEDGYSLVHFKNGTNQHGGIIRSSKGIEDDGNAPLLLQASRYVMQGSAVGTPFANGNILGMSTSAGQGNLVFGILNSAGDGFIQSAKTGGPSTLVLNPEGGMVEVPCLRVQGCDIIENTNSTETLYPGEVIVIDPTRPNHVLRSNKAYDYMTIGVISGAGGVTHGMMLSQEGVLDGNVSFAIAGRVKVKITGKVQPGDLLTTSDLPGHAMVAKNRRKRDGAVMGKALSAPDSEGLVLMLVMMQ